MLQKVYCLKKGSKKFHHRDTEATEFHSLRKRELCHSLEAMLWLFSLCSPCLGGYSSLFLGTISGEQGCPSKPQVRIRQQVLRHHGLVVPKHRG